MTNRDIWGLVGGFFLGMIIFNSIKYFNESVLAYWVVIIFIVILVIWLWLIIGTRLLFKYLYRRLNKDPDLKVDFDLVLKSFLYAGPAGLIILLSSKPFEKEK